MRTESLLHADVLATWRLLNYRLQKHAILSAFIIVSVVGLSYLIVWGILVIMDGGVELGLTRRDTMLLMFGIMLARSITYTYNRFLKSREMQYIMSSPVPERDLAFNRLQLNFILLGTLFTIALGLFWSSILIAGTQGLGPGNLPPTLIYELLVLFALALFFGYSIPVKVQVRPVKRATVLLLPEIYTGFLLFLVLPISGDRIAPDPVYLVMISITLVIGLESFFMAIPLAKTGWARQTMKMGASRPMRAPVHFSRSAHRFWGSRLSSLVTKEVKIVLREKEFVGNLLVSVSIVVLVAVTFLYFPLDLASGMEGNSYLVYPMLIGFSLYLIGVLMGALTNLSMVGIEGKAMWNLKVLPILGWEVMWSKAIATFLVAWPVMMAAALTVPLLGQYPIAVTVFFAVEANAFLLAFIGLGSWASAAYPSFDDMEHGMPDILIQILMLIFTFIVAIFIGAIPAIIMRADHLYGLFACMVALLFSIVIFELGVRGGAYRYELIDAEVYSGGVNYVGKKGKFIDYRY